MSNKKQEWIDALPEDNHTVEINFRPDYNVEYDRIDWVFTLRSIDFNSEKYYFKTSFSIYDEVWQENDVQPMKIDRATYEIEKGIQQVVMDYITKEIIGNE